MTDYINRADAIEAIDDAIDADSPQWAILRTKIGFLPSAEAVQGWIPCSERLPEDLEAVNVTWVNHNPPVYYQYTKDVPNADTAVYYRGVWYWWDSTICDVLGEYGEKCGAEQIDKDIEILAWMPLPKPYKGGDDE